MSKTRDKSLIEVDACSQTLSVTSTDRSDKEPKVIMKQISNNLLKTSKVI